MENLHNKFRYYDISADHLIWFRDAFRRIETHLRVVLEECRRKHISLHSLCERTLNAIMLYEKFHNVSEKEGEMVFKTPSQFPTWEICSLLGALVHESQKSRSCVALSEMLSVVQKVVELWLQLHECSLKNLKNNGFRLSRTIYDFWDNEFLNKQQFCVFFEFISPISTLSSLSFEKLSKSSPPWAKHYEFRIEAWETFFNHFHLTCSPFFKGTIYASCQTTPDLDQIQLKVIQIVVSFCNVTACFFSLQDQFDFKKIDPFFYFLSKQYNLVKGDVGTQSEQIPCFYKLFMTLLFFLCFSETVHLAARAGVLQLFQLLLDKYFNRVEEEEEQNDETKQSSLNLFRLYFVFILRQLACTLYVLCPAHSIFVSQHSLEILGQQYPEDNCFNICFELLLLLLNKTQNIHSRHAFAVSILKFCIEPFLFHFLSNPCENLLFLQQTLLILQAYLRFAYLVCSDSNGPLTELYVAQHCAALNQNSCVFTFLVKQSSFQPFLQAILSQVSESLCSVENNATIALLLHFFYSIFSHPNFFLFFLPLFTSQLHSRLLCVLNQFCFQQSNLKELADFPESRMWKISEKPSWWSEPLCTIHISQDQSSRDLQDFSQFNALPSKDSVTKESRHFNENKKLSLHTYWRLSRFYDIPTDTHHTKWYTPLGGVNSSINDSLKFKFANHPFDGSGTISVNDMISNDQTCMPRTLPDESMSPHTLFQKGLHCFAVSLTSLLGLLYKEIDDSIGVYICMDCHSYQIDYSFVPHLYITLDSSIVYNIFFRPLTRVQQKLEAQLDSLWTSFLSFFSLVLTNKAFSWIPSLNWLLEMFEVLVALLSVFSVPKGLTVCLDFLSRFISKLVESETMDYAVSGFHSLNETEGDVLTESSIQSSLFLLLNFFFHIPLHYGNTFDASHWMIVFEMIEACCPFFQHDEIRTQRHWKSNLTSEEFNLEEHHKHSAKRSSLPIYDELEMAAKKNFLKLNTVSRTRSESWILVANQISELFQNSCFSLPSHHQLTKMLVVFDLWFENFFQHFHSTERTTYKEPWSVYCNQPKKLVNMLMSLLLISSKLNQDTCLLNFKFEIKGCFLTYNNASICPSQMALEMFLSLLYITLFYNSQRLLTIADMAFVCHLFLNLLRHLPTISKLLSVECLEFLSLFAAQLMKNSNVASQNLVLKNLDAVRAQVTWLIPHSECITLILAVYFDAFLDADPYSIQHPILEHLYSFLYSKGARLHTLLSWTVISLLIGMAGVLCFDCYSAFWVQHIRMLQCDIPSLLIQKQPLFEYNKSTRLNLWGAAQKNILFQLLELVVLEFHNRIHQPTAIVLVALTLSSIASAHECGHNVSFTSVGLLWTLSDSLISRACRVTNETPEKLITHDTLFRLSDHPYYEIQLSVGEDFVGVPLYANLTSISNEELYKVVIIIFYLFRYPSLDTRIEVRNCSLRSLVSAYESNARLENQQEIFKKSLESTLIAVCKDIIAKYKSLLCNDSFGQEGSMLHNHALQHHSRDSHLKLWDESLAILFDGILILIQSERTFFHEPKETVYSVNDSLQTTSQVAIELPQYLLLEPKWLNTASLNAISCCLSFVIAVIIKSSALDDWRLIHFENFWVLFERFSLFLWESCTFFSRLTDLLLSSVQRISFHVLRSGFTGNALRISGCFLACVRILLYLIYCDDSAKDPDEGKKKEADNHAKLSFRNREIKSPFKVSPIQFNFFKNLFSITTCSYNPYPISEKLYTTLPETVLNQIYQNLDEACNHTGVLSDPNDTTLNHFHLCNHPFLNTSCSLAYSQRYGNFSETLDDDFFNQTCNAFSLRSCDHKNRCPPILTSLPMTLRDNLNSPEKDQQKDVILPLQFLSTLTCVKIQPEQISLDNNQNISVVYEVPVINCVSDIFDDDYVSPPDWISTTSSGSTPKCNPNLLLVDAMKLRRRLVYNQSASLIDMCFQALEGLDFWDAFLIHSPSVWFSVLNQCLGFFFDFWNPNLYSCILFRSMNCFTRILRKCFLTMQGLENISLQVWSAIALSIFQFTAKILVLIARRFHSLSPTCYFYLLEVIIQILLDVHHFCQNYSTQQAMQDTGPYVILDFFSVILVIFSDVWLETVLQLSSTISFKHLEESHEDLLPLCARVILGLNQCSSHYWTSKHFPLNLFISTVIFLDTIILAGYHLKFQNLTKLGFITIFDISFMYGYQTPLTEDLQRKGHVLIHFLIKRLKSFFAQFCLDEAQSGKCPMPRFRLDDLSFVLGRLQHLKVPPEVTFLNSLSQKNTVTYDSSDFNRHFPSLAMLTDRNLTAILYPDLLRLITTKNISIRQQLLSLLNTLTPFLYTQMN